MWTQNQCTKLNYISNKAATICYKTQILQVPFIIATKTNKQKYIHMLK